MVVAVVGRKIEDGGFMKYEESPEIWSRHLAAERTAWIVRGSVPNKYS